MTEHQANEPQSGPAAAGNDAESAREGGQPASEPYDENHGKPPSQVEAENPSDEQIAQERAEMESRMPGGANRAPSDPRDSEAARND